MIDSGRIRTPVSIADSPSATERNSGTAKNSPACSRYWKKNDDHALAQQSDPQDHRVEQRRLTGLAAVPLPARGTRRRTATPPSISQTTGERPSQVGAPGFGCANPQIPDPQDPEDDQAQAESGQRGADAGRVRRLPRAACRPCAG